MRDNQHRTDQSDSIKPYKMISIKSNQLAIKRLSPRVNLESILLLMIGSSILTPHCCTATQHLQQQNPDHQYLLMGTADHQQALQQLDPSAEYSLNNELLAAANEQQQIQANEQQQQHASPGHYEFDVAPKMEPPTVRKPPYRQTAQTCPGSDLLGGFSPRDTLCGDLNQGKVPLNPLGQSITDQAYPFELIKNKTLQFLAKALPVLKLEYETIPKVARYLPANHLLNPTHHGSPLGDGHFHQLNQRFASTAAMPSGDLLFDPATNSMKRRRRRSINQAKQQQVASFTVAELAPNATLVVSSAHSQTSGRIQAKRSSIVSDSHSAPHHHHLMITKDGLRQISSGNQNSSPTSSLSSASSPTSTSSSVVVVVPNPNSRDHEQSRKLPATTTVNVNESAVAPTKSLSNNQQQNLHNLSTSGNSNRQQSSRGGDNLGAEAALTAGRNHANQKQTIQGQKFETANRVAASESNEHSLAGSQLEARSSSPAVSNGQPSSENLSPASSGRQSGGNNNISGSGDKTSSTAAAQRSRLNCAGLGSAIASTVCQTAAALIEGDKPPAWIQVAKQLGNLYASSGSADSLAGWPLLGLLGVGGGGGATASLLNGGQSDAAPTEQTDAKSSSPTGAKQSTPTASSVWSILTPLASLLTPSMQKDSSESHHHHHHQTTGVQTKRNDHQHKSSALSLADQLSASTLTKMALAGWATTALAGLVEYFIPSTLSSASSTFARRRKPFDPSETFVDTPASLAAMSAAANLKSSLTSPSGSLPLAGGGGNSITKQPPTPCPSVEEYISPTFARNYQGAWKYVVQIPHEGYFTQTIQRSSCVRQKCEFTDGVCHEAPRWVSLLVAEIYYPNAVFSTTSQNQISGLSEQQQQQQQQPSPGQVQQNMMASSTSNNLQQVALGHQPSEHHQQQLYRAQAHKQQHLQQPKQFMGQDPLQMTDSFNNYNSAAFLNAAANQLGIDPTNVAQMQQLADVHNYQLIQRNGQLMQPASGANQQQIAESRASHTVVAQPTSQARQFTSVAQHQQQQQTGHNQIMNDMSPNMSYDQYIRALAAETLRQNPHLTIDDLIKSLQLQTNRRKRDLQHSNANEQNKLIQQQQLQQANSQQQQQQYNQIQYRSSPMSVESSSSLNDLGASLTPQQKQVFNQATPNPIDQSQMKQQQQPLTQQTPSSTNDGAGNQNSNSIASSQESSQTATASSSTNTQTECDGHDKIGCYVVRVYYDWFLVNGSCKCWKTGASNASQQNQQQQGGGNSFLRRIFTG